MNRFELLMILLLSSVSVQASVSGFGCILSGIVSHSVSAYDHHQASEFEKNLQEKADQGCFISKAEVVLASAFLLLVCTRSI